MTQTLTEKVKSQQSTVKEEPIFDLPVDKPHIFWGDRAFCSSYWTEASLEKESLIQEVIDFFLLHKYFIIVDQGWSDWDLEIYRGIWSRAEIKVCTENHGGNKRLLRVRCALRMSQFATMAMVGYSLLIVISTILGMPEMAVVAVVVCALNAAVIVYQNFYLGWIFHRVLKTIAKKLCLLPIYTTSTKIATPSAILKS